MRSAFSAWSSADDDDGDDDSFAVEDDVPLIPTTEQCTGFAQTDAHTSPVLGFFQAPNDSSFLFPCTPLEDDEKSDGVKGFDPALPEVVPENQDDNDYPSSSLSQPHLTTSSVPSYSSSSASASSYFDCKRPLAITPRMKNRLIAALTPPLAHGKTIVAISPWEGDAVTSVHDVHVESNQRVRVDGMSFDMLRDFVVPGRLSTPC